MSKALRRFLALERMPLAIQGGQRQGVRWLALLPQRATLRTWPLPGPLHQGHRPQVQRGPLATWSGFGPKLRWPYLLLLLLVAIPLPAAAIGVLRVGVLDGSPPCSQQHSRGQWQGSAVSLWELMARREGLAYLMRGYPDPRSLLEATRKDQVDIGVGCLTMSPERVGRYRFSLPFQEHGLALMVPSRAGGNFVRLLRSVVTPQMLKVIGGYLLVIGLISALIWRAEHRGDGSSSLREQLRRFAYVYQVMASGPGTNTIVTRTRGHALVLLAWVIRIIGASLIVSTITIDALRDPTAHGFQPRRLTDLVGLRIAVRPGSVSEQLLQKPPLAGRATLVSLSALENGPELLLQGKVNGVLADEQQLRYVLEQAPVEQRSRLRLALKGTYRESQAFVYSPHLDPTLATRLDRAISQAKRDGLVP